MICGCIITPQRVNITPGVVLQMTLKYHIPLHWVNGDHTLRYLEETEQLRHIFTPLMRRVVTAIFGAATTGATLGGQLGLGGGLLGILLKSDQFNKFTTI